MKLALKGTTFNGIKRAIRQNRDIKPFLKVVSQKLRSSYALGFKNSTDPDGNKWAPITHRQGQPLRDTGRLQRSLRAKVEGFKIIIGTNVDYAKAQQFGSTETVTVPAHVKLITQAFGKPLKFPVHANVKSHKKKQNIKARPFLGFGLKQKSVVNKAWIRWIKDGKK